MSNNVKRGVRVFLCVVAFVFLVAATSASAGIFSSIKGLKSLSVSQVDLSQVQDGEYEGEYDGKLVKAKVRVTVSGHRITEVLILKHENGLGRKAESIVKTVVEAQSLAVDTVSGATASSKVILKAIESALQKGIA